MMNRILLIFCFILSLIAGDVSLAHASSIRCDTAIDSVVHVTAEKSNVKYDFSKTKKQLNEIDVTTVSPYGPNHKTYVSGLMSGSIQLKAQTHLAEEVYRRTNQGCFYIKLITVNLNVDPTVFIAKEYPKGSCLHNAVLTHEYKHVNEDQLIVNKYSYLIEQALYAAIESHDGGFGPYSIKDIPNEKQKVQSVISRIIKKYNQEMNEERRRRQQAIDNLEEYQSIGKRCKPQKRG